MSYCGYITKLENVRPHPNADRLVLADVLGATVIVGSSCKTGDVVVYFPSDGQLSEEYCQHNDLVRRKDENGNDVGGYLDPIKRNVRMIKLRGEYSDGLVLRLDSLAYTGIDLDTLTIGTMITTVNGCPICCKYIPRKNEPAVRAVKNGKVRHSEPQEQTPYFVEHVDTPQLRFVMDNFKPGDVISLTEKVHGTSSRNSYGLVITPAKRTLIDRILRRPAREIKTHRYLVGTRRTTVRDTTGGYYGSNQFRIDWGKQFVGKLHEGENCYGEIAGYVTGSAEPIMATADNKKTNDKEFIKQYGKTTTFSYGCESGESRYFIYRMTYTDDNGYTIEYPWDMVVQRAKQMGFETVPELERFIYTTEEDFMARVNKWLDIPSTIDPRHVIEGVVVRAINDPGLRIAKAKSLNFKYIENILKADASAPDMEEAEDIQEVVE